MPKLKKVNIINFGRYEYRAFYEDDTRQHPSRDFATASQ